MKTTLMRVSVVVSLLIVGPAFHPTIVSAATPTLPGNLVKNPAADPGNNNTPQFTWTASADQATAVAAYETSLDQASFVDQGQSLSYRVASPLSDGPHMFSVRARDTVGDESAPTTINFTIDTTPPVVQAPVPTNAAIHRAITIASGVTDRDAFGVASCRLIVNGADQGGMALDANQDIPGAFIASKSYAFSAAGAYAVYVHCADKAGNGAGSAIAAVNVSGARHPPAADRTIFGAASAVIADPRFVADDNASFSTITVTARNAAGQALSGKTITLTSSRADDTVEVGSMPTDAQGTARFHVRSSSAGASKLFVWSGGLAIGATAVTFIAPEDLPNPNPILPAARRLIKLACPPKAKVGHPCTAVYYQGSDGERHAFPNEKTYFSWYHDFSAVQIVGPVEMTAIPLGKNVAYRPGVRMVKFATLDNVYVVARGGVLRWVRDESTARTLYGSDWNKNIDDIPDAFYVDYQFGADLNAAADFFPAQETANVPIIDLNL